MRVLVLGSGARELAICQALLKSRIFANDQSNKIYYAADSTNPGIDVVANQYINLDRVDQVGDINLCIISGENYLAAGWTDRMILRGVPTFAPTANAARLETSKIFTRRLLENNNLSEFSPNWTAFPRFSEATKLEQNNFPGNCFKKYVIKANGLHGGKGVFVQDAHFTSGIEAREIWRKLDDSIIIEERIDGEEFSLMTISDGETCFHMPIVRDYKRASAGNTGPNTGGMGAISFANHSMPFLSLEDVQNAQQLNERVIGILSESGTRYCGVLYGGFIKETSTGRIKLLEYNCRFGDPEAINVLAILQSDFFDICWHAAFGTLRSLAPPIFANRATYVRYYCPPGYPTSISESPITFSFDGVDPLLFSKIMFADARRSIHPKFTSRYQTGTSRTLALVGVGTTLSEARAALEDQELQLPINDLMTRRDIGDDLRESSAYLNHLRDSGTLIHSLKNCITKSWNGNVKSRFGDYAGIYQLTQDAQLVTSVDGVGTKPDVVRKFYGDAGLESIGHDLVNHCVNDILVKGARPLFFTDYVAGAKLEATQMWHFLKGVSDACLNNGFCLISGESAEMRGTYHHGKLDFVGNIVGIIDDEKMAIDGKRDISKGDYVYGLFSSGPHTNGYTVIADLDTGNIPANLIRDLCAPHRSYLDEVAIIRQHLKINGLIHITGGGFKDNPPRVLPDDLDIEYWKFSFPPVFKMIQNHTALSDEEMLTIFNCGFGMLVVVSETDVPKMERLIINSEIQGARIGTVVPRILKK